MSKQAKNSGSSQRWGYIDREGELVIPFQFESADPFSEGLASVTKEGRQGAIDRTGHWVIPSTFDALGPFEDGIAYAIQDDKWGCVDRSGQFVLAPVFDFLGSFRDGLARAEVGELTGYVDRAGQWRIPPRFESAEDFIDGFALVRDPSDDSDRWFLNVRGEMMYGPFGDAEHFSEGWASVWVDNGNSFIDTAGKRVLRLAPGMQASWFYEGLAPTMAPGPKVIMGYIDRKGKWAIPPKFDHAGPFCQGLASVEIAEKWGIIDKSGKLLLSPQFDYIEHLNEGRAVYVPTRTGRWGYLDENAGVCIEPVYALAKRFSEGLAPVCIEQESKRENSKENKKAKFK